MNYLKKLNHYIDSLCIYDVKRDPVIASLQALLQSVEGDGVIRCQSDFYHVLSSHGALKPYIASLILENNNVFTKACAAKKQSQLPPSVMDGVKSDLTKLEAIASLTAKEIADGVSDSEIKEILASMPTWDIGNATAPLTQEWDKQIDALAQFYAENGYGDYVKYAAFTWRDKAFVPITSLNAIRLTDLKNYESQRQQAVDNTLSFLEGYPANNILLYGDRGTGKSSTVHAILNEYQNRGLRMIEISKGDIGDLTLIREKIAQSPMKFIIFIDDLSFDSHEDSFGELKAALEGSLSGKQSNTLIYATSNRRHLIKENFDDRENDVHRSDTMQEELSLSDRFGLSITFMNPDKKDYLDIVEQIAADRGITLDTAQLLDNAERWARRRGGRSPRCAKQFIDYVESCEKRGITPS